MILRSKGFGNSCGIVYCHSVNDCIDLAKEFRKLGLKAAAYHGQMEYERRQDIHQKWMDNEYKIICATVAFGMGIGIKYFIYFI